MAILLPVQGQRDSLMVFIPHQPLIDVVESIWICYPSPSPGRDKL